MQIQKRLDTIERVKQAVTQESANIHNMKSAYDITDLEKQIVDGNYIDNIIKAHREQDKPFDNFAVLANTKTALPNIAPVFVQLLSQNLNRCGFAVGVSVCDHGIFNRDFHTHKIVSRLQTVKVDIVIEHISECNFI